MMKLAIVVAAFVALTTAMPSDDDSFVRREFELFRQKYGKNYQSAEEVEKRFGIFKRNWAKIQEHNLSGKSWTEGITKFSDLTKEEFKASYLGGFININRALNPSEAGHLNKNSDIDLSQLPAEKDWLDAITDVKDQGICGSCWAFTAVELLESYAYLNSQQKIELSAQQLTSCTPNELRCGGGGGCLGLVPNLAFAYTQLFGFTTEERYPYTSGNNGITGDCQYDASSSVGISRGFEVLPRNDYAAIMDHIANKGPLSIAVAASDWGNYRGGVFDGCSYSENIEINHAVQLVGYGTDENGVPYWLVRNQWGTDWGDEGFMKLKRDSGDAIQCGFDTTPLSGTACVDDGNESQYVCGACGMLYDTVYPIGVELVPN